MASWDDSPAKKKIKIKRKENERCCIIHVIDGNDENQFTTLIPKTFGG